MTAETGYYNIENTFKQFSTLEKGGKLPIDTKDPVISGMINNPKRVHYKVLPTHLWTPSKGGTSTKSRNLNYYLDTVSYNFLRKKSLEAIQLQIEVPGNLALTAGEGVKVEIPRMQAKRKKVELTNSIRGRIL